MKMQEIRLLGLGERVGLGGDEGGKVVLDESHWQVSSPYLSTLHRFKPHRVVNAFSPPLSLVLHRSS